MELLARETTLLAVSDSSWIYSGASQTSWSQFVNLSRFSWLQWIEFETNAPASVSQTNMSKYGPTGGNSYEETFQEGNLWTSSPEATFFDGCAAPKSCLSPFEMAR